MLTNVIQKNKTNKAQILKFNTEALFSKNVEKLNKIIYHFLMLLAV